MKKIAPALAALLLLLLAAAVSAGAAVASGLIFVDNFEGYANDAQLRAVWTPVAGAPGPNPDPFLLLSGGAGGGQAMSLGTFTTTPVRANRPAFAVPVPDGTVVEYNLGSMNLSGVQTLTIWVRRGADAVPGDLLNVGLVSSGVVTHLDSLAVDGLAGWTRWDVDITAVSPRSSVNYLRLNLDAVERSGTSGAALSAVYEVALVDEITFNNGAVWRGDNSLAPAAAPWNGFASWVTGPPAAGSDALIPGVPTEGNFPVLTANTAVANLTVDAGAALDLAGFDLTVSGTLGNAGAISQDKAVPDSGGAIGFVNTGGYGGLGMAQSDVCLALAPNSPACLLGAQAAVPTAVTISGAACPGNPGGVARCFNISPASVPGSGFNVTFYFSAADLPPGVTCAAVNLYHYNSSSKTWDTPGSFTTRQCSSQPYSLTASDVSSFSTFALSNVTPTAVRLQTFQARPAPFRNLLHALFD